MEIWQADATRPLSPSGRPAAVIWRTRRSQASAARQRQPAARFSFGPSSRAVSAGPDGRAQAPHILVSVMARGVMSRCWTRIYFEGEPLNATDPILQLVPAERRDTLIARRAGEGEYEFNIVLQGEKRNCVLRCVNGARVRSGEATISYEVDGDPDAPVAPPDQLHRQHARDVGAADARVHERLSRHPLRRARARHLVGAARSVHAGSTRPRCARDPRRRRGGGRPCVRDFARRDDRAVARTERAESRPQSGAGQHGGAHRHRRVVDRAHQPRAPEGHVSGRRPGDGALVHAGVSRSATRKPSTPSGRWFRTARRMATLDAAPRCAMPTCATRISSISAPTLLIASSGGHRHAAGGPRLHPRARQRRAARDAGLGAFEQRRMRGGVHGCCAGLSEASYSLTSP